MSFKIDNRGVVAEQAITRKHTGLTRADEGKPVKLAADNGAVLCADGDAVFGVMLAVESDACSVLHRGVVTLSYTGADPTVGAGFIAADGAGKVKVTTSNPHAAVWILSVDSAAKTVTFILNN